MYQFYYSRPGGLTPPAYKRSAAEEFNVTAIRPAMWEEHCLECSAPACYGTCAHYRARSDGRCRLLDNGYAVYPDPKGCCGQGVRVKFRRWGNMMTVIFPAMLTPGEYGDLTAKNQKLGERLEKVASGPFPKNAKWQTIRTAEYIRRRGLRRLAGLPNKADAFLFHGWSFEQQSFRLCMEIYDDHAPKFKTSLTIEPGENLIILGSDQLGEACNTPGYLVKLYPENDLEAELDILWADFVQGSPAAKEKPADKVKCVVWDLDNTFWDGILIETEDPDTLQPLPGVMDMIRALDEKGILQSVASKNDYTQAWPVLERLGIADYFLYPQINWGAKSASIRAIAESLNIGTDTFLLLDDSAFERSQVRAMLPQVRVFDPANLGTLLNGPEFDVPVTAESRSRREMYRAEEKRTALMESSSADTVEFLRMCHLRMTLFVPRTEEELLRSFELAARTNQLNMSGNKYTPEEFDRVLGREGSTNFAFSCEDDFGTYGIVGFGQYRVEEKTLVFSEFAMSCRVAGKFVESALFTALLKREGCEKGSFTVKKTKKNILLRRTLEEIGFHTAHETQEQIEYHFDNQLVNSGLSTVRTRDITQS